MDNPAVGQSGAFAFLQSRPLQILTVLLLAQATLFYGFTGEERVPLVQPLGMFPIQTASWAMSEEGVVEKEVADVLKADDLLTRNYVSRDFGNIPANLFIAYFQTQRTGKAPHSPKNCLPGSGWAQLQSGSVEVPIPGSAPITVNRYVVAKGESKSLVMYWYQSRNRVVASEYTAKIYLVLDSIRYHRSDTALVRVVVPVVEGKENLADAAAVSFIQSFFQDLKGYFPA